MDPDSNNQDAPKDTVGRRLIQIGLLVATFAVLNRVLLRPWVLSPEAYFESVLFPSTLMDLFSPSLRLAVVALATGIFLVKFRQALMAWQNFEDGQALRAITTVCAFILAWVYSTYDYNHYFSQSHIVDRLILWFMFGLVVWRPVFVLPMMIAAWPISGQFQVPLAGYSWTIIHLPARILMLVAATHLIGLITQRWRTQHYWFVLLCLIAGHYFPSGWGKTRIGWLEHDQVYFLLPNTYASGWLSFLDPDQIEGLTKKLAWINGPIKVATLLVELGAVFVLCHPKITKGLLLAWAVFHVGIVSVSGIFLWPWIVIDSAVLILIWRSKTNVPTVFSRIEMALSIILIALASVWTNSVGLVWIDSPVTNTYRVIALGEGGNEYAISQSVIAPYDYQFSLCSFAHLLDQPTLPVTWGAAKLPTYLALRDAKTMDDVLEIERKIGDRQFDQVLSNEMKKFLVAFARDLNRSADQSSFPVFLRAPKTILHFPPENEFCHQEPIVAIKITRTVTGMIDGTYQESDPMTVLTTGRIEPLR